MKIKHIIPLICNLGGILSALAAEPVETPTNQSEPSLPVKPANSIQETEGITQPEIEIPDTWHALDIPESFEEKNLKGILKGGSNSTGTKGALLSIIPLNAERFKEITNPLEDLAWIVKEGDKTSGFTPTSERQIQTSMGAARIVTSNKSDGNIQTWILIHGTTGICIKLFTSNTADQNLANPSDDPELKAIVKSLRLPKITTSKL